MSDTLLEKDIHALILASKDTTPERVAAFFKTGAGQYSAHDQFLGIRIPTLRQISRSCHHFSLDQVTYFLTQPFNELRYFALILLLHRLKCEVSMLDVVYQFYRQYLEYINNWNLVDLSAAPIVGAYTLSQGNGDVVLLSASSNLWRRRIAIVSTAYSITRGDFSLTLELAERYFHDSETLIHQATGWMLREVGKKDTPMLSDFLDVFAHQMPRTMLRYAIEHYPQSIRTHYLSKKKSL